jgi:hypothetical protein
MISVRKLFRCFGTVKPFIGPCLIFALDNFQKTEHEQIFELKSGSYKK